MNKINKKFTFPKIPKTLPLIGIVSSLVFVNLPAKASEITINPIPEVIQKSSFSISFKEIVQIPNSTGSSRVPRLNFLASANENDKRLFTNDMRGQLYTIKNSDTNIYLDLKSIIGSNFLDTDGQQGFISFTFDPNFKENGIFYTVNTEIKGNKTADFQFTKPIFNNQGNIVESSHHDVIRQWTATQPSSDSFSGTMREILRIEQPYRDHNTGQIGFNPNAQIGSSDYGMLYVATGDGGSDGFPVRNTDPLNNAQNLSVPLGKILRIDPIGNNSANGQYGIPIDNPFVNDDNANTLSEIWANGLRNPHRFSWDTEGDGKMLIADIGQNFIEEINLGIKGANYGWGQREGTFVTQKDNQNILFPLPENDGESGYTYPVAQYDHDINGLVSIAGGYVYRGSAMPELVGKYIFADFANDGRFFSVDADQLVNGQQAIISELRILNGGQETTFLNLINKSRSDVRFGVDEAGEIYITNKQDGIIRQIISSSDSAAVPEPLTILGAMTAAGFGTVFKRKLVQCQKDT